MPDPPNKEEDPPINRPRDNIDKGDDKKTITTRRSSTSSNNTSPMKATNSTQKNGEWLPDSRKSAYTTSPTLAANTELNQLNKNQPPRTTSPAVSSKSSSSSSTTSASANNSGQNPPPPRPPKDGLQYANLDHRAFMQDPRNRVLPGSASLPASTTYATVKTREVVQTSSRTFGGNQPRA